MPAYKAAESPPFFWAVSQPELKQLLLLMVFFSVPTASEMLFENLA